MTISRTVTKSAMAATLLVAGLGIQPAAAISCRGPDQLVNGRWIGTPYCQDNYIARVARRAYGIRVSDRAIRQNPSRKAEICRHIGNDIRINSYCQGDLPDGSRWRR